MFLASSATVHHALNIAVGPISITGFGIAVASAFVLGQMIASREMERRGFSADPVADIVAATLVGFHHRRENLLTPRSRTAGVRSSPAAGFVFWGGFAGSVAPAP